MICSIDGCGNKAIRRGLCDKHAYGGVTRRQRNKLSAQVQEDQKQLRLQSELTTLKGKYKEALGRIARQELELGALKVLGDATEPVKIEPRFGSGTSEATPVILASDWHVEEIVGAEVSGLNRYNLEIAEQSAKVFFQGALRLLRLLNQDVKISQVVLALLGDFITGQIHGAENAEKNALPPNQAVVFAQNLLIGGFEFLLEHTPYEFVIPAHSGNHARTTHTTRFAVENGHSLEYLMYLHLAAYFRNEPRMKFQIAEGYHSYVDVYGQTLRFHHGHAIKSAGGVGGFFAPVYTKIARWNKGRRADVDLFGHFHQMRDGGNFLSNGSMIGYNAFALSIGADYEPPKQAIHLFDKRRGRTSSWPILFPPRV